MNPTATTPIAAEAPAVAGATKSTVVRRLLSRMGTMLIPAGILVAAASIALSSTRWNEWVGDRSLQSTDDAHVRADITQLSTKSQGTVAKVAVVDYQRVKAGDLLVQLNDEDFRAQVELAEASLRSARAALLNVRRQRGLQATRIAQADANVRASQADLQRSRLERVREEALERADVTTRQRVETAIADHERSEATTVGREAELASQRKQVGILEAQEQQLEAEVAAKEASLKLAKVNLEYTRIVAPTDGVVGERKVRPGQLVSAGTQVISLVGDDVWVIANFKETQIARMQGGTRADLTVDGIPGAVWHGHVETVAPASGSQFSLLPPDNATGNYTKVAQRIPVKIVFEPGQPQAERLRSGMSAIVNVKVTP